MPWLRIETGEFDGQTFCVSDSAVVGRDPGCDVCIPSPDVSRRHCRIFVRGERHYVEDLNSRNGTAVNDDYHERTELQDLDHILLGRVELTFFMYPPGKDLRSTRTPDGLDTEIPDSSLSVSVVMDAAELHSSFESLDQPKALKRLDTFFRVGQALAEKADEDSVFPEILDCLLKIYPQASRAYS